MANDKNNTDNARALIAADVDRVQGYVFESAKLAEMRGASLILDLLNVKNSNEAEWGDVEIAKRPVKGVPELLRDLGLSDDALIFAGGGNLLMEAPLAEADNIRRRIEQLYIETTLMATTSAAAEPLVSLDSDALRSAAQRAKGEAWRLIRDNLVREQEWHQCENPGRLDETHFQRVGHFGHLYNAVAYRLRRIKQSKTRAPLFEVSPFTERCAYCHFRPAFRLAPETDERPICRVCHRKRQDRGDRAAHSFYLAHFRKYLDRHRGMGKILPYDEGSYSDWSDIESPPDLDSIAQAARSKTKNFVGVIYADGNNMGACLESIERQEDFGPFAREMRWTIQESVFSGLAEHLDGYRTGKCARVKDGKRCERDHKYHPFEIISIGGDDVYLFVPADAALEIARHICRRFEEMCHASRNSSVQGLTLSAGVLMAHVSTPVYFSRAIVKGLLRNAKVLSKSTTPPQSAIDFQVVTADTAISEDIEPFRTQTYRNRFSAERLTARPLTLEALDKLIQAVRELKAKSFPKSQLYALREAVIRGPQPRATNFYYYQLARDEEKYEPLHRFLANNGDEAILPFLARKGNHDATDKVTQIVDLIEIYDFVRNRAAR